MQQLLTAVAIALLAAVVSAESSYMEITSIGEETIDADLGIPKVASNILIGSGLDTMSLSDIKVLNVTLISSGPVIFDAKLVTDNFWYGEERYDPSIHGNPAGQMGSANLYLSTNRKGSITGSIVHNSSIFQIQTDADQVMKVLKIKSSDFPSEAEPQKPSDDESNTTAVDDDPSSRQLATEEDELDTIDVMVVYTLRTMCFQANQEYPCEDTAENRAPIEDRIALAVEETNAMYAMSGVIGRMHLVRAYFDPTYDEVIDGKLDFPTIADHLQTADDGYLGDVHAEREMYGADLVSLWAVEGNYCGYAWTGQRAMSKEWAFAVIQLSCATGYFTYGHEHGHNQGCTHDIQVRQEKDRSPASAIVKGHGFLESEYRFRTNMAYDTYCEDPGCPKIQRFSTPNSTWYNQSIGSATEDCVWQLNRSWRNIASLMPKAAPPNEESEMPTDPDDTTLEEENEYDDKENSVDSSSGEHAMILTISCFLSSIVVGFAFI